jgi:ABC-type transport system involved in multi-copper enzyme maturation permease subunit
MTFLPVVERELRVAARRKSTFSIRGTVTLLAVVISGFLFLADAVAKASVANAGAMVFRTLSWYTWIFSLLAGVFLASDCLSQERREGTLGFLFLTDLTGGDVVLGKFAAAGLNAFYGLLAVLPVLSLCLLAGGVTGGECWRMGLALLNTLFFAVAAALWVSANCQSASGAVAASILLLMAFLGVTVLAAALGAVATRWAAALFYIGAVSPLEAFRRAPEAGFWHEGGQFWVALGVSHLVAWGFRRLASWRLKFFTETARSSGVWQRLLPVNVLGGKAERTPALLDVNPVLWLLDDSRRLRRMVWSVTLAGAAPFILLACVWRDQVGFFAIFLAWPFYFVLKVLFGIQACRFFGEARRSGAMEMFACTPITMQIMIRGQWLALRRVFLWPVVVLFAANLVCVAATSFPFASVHNGIPILDSALFPLQALLRMANSVADFFALGWFGMWNALSLQKWSAATGRTLLYVLILPVILFCVPTLATDAVFIVIGWTKLQADFRGRAGETAGWR